MATLNNSPHLPLDVSMETLKETSATQSDDRLLDLLNTMLRQQKSFEYRIHMELDNLVAKQEALQYNVRLEANLHNDRYAEVRAELDVCIQMQRNQAQKILDLSEHRDLRNPFPEPMVSNVELMPRPRYWEENALESEVEPTKETTPDSNGRLLEADAGEPQMIKPGICEAGVPKLDMGVSHHQMLLKKVDAIEHALLRWRLLDSVNELGEVEPPLPSGTMSAIDSIALYNSVHNQHLHVDDKETERLIDNFTKMERAVAKHIISPGPVFRLCMDCAIPSENTHDSQKRRMRFLYAIVLLLGCSAGLLAATFDELTVRAVAVVLQTSEDDTDEEENALNWVGRAITIFLCFAWAIVELLLLQILGLVAAIFVVRVRNLVLVPLNCSRAEVLQGIIRAAAMTDFSTEAMKGISPLGRMTRAQLALFKAKERIKKQRTVCKNVCRMMLKRLVKSPANRRILIMLLSRTSLKLSVYGPYIGFFVACCLNMIINLANMRYRMDGIHVCCTGPQYISTVLEALFHIHKKASGKRDMGDELKIMCCRAIAVAVVSKKCWHPNLSFAVNCLETLLTNAVVERASEDVRLRYDVEQGISVEGASSSPGFALGGKSKEVQKWATEVDKNRHAQLEPLRLDDVECFLAVLKSLEPVDADLVLTILALGLTLDGNATKQDMQVMRKCLETAEPPRQSNPAFLTHFAEHIYHDKNPSVEFFLAYIRDAGPDDGQASSCFCF